MLWNYLSSAYEHARDSTCLRSGCFMTHHGGQQGAVHQCIIALGCSKKHLGRCSERMKGYVWSPLKSSAQGNDASLVSLTRIRQVFSECANTNTTAAVFRCVLCHHYLDAWLEHHSFCTWSPVWGCPHDYLALESWWLAYVGAVPLRQLPVVASLYCSYMLTFFL